MTRKQAAQATAEQRGRKRKLRRTLVTATCQFPFEEHPFSYVKTTRPQVYCDAHRDGWTDDDGVRHGDQRRVRVIREAIPVFTPKAGEPPHEPPHYAETASGPGCGCTITGWTDGEVIGRQLVFEPRADPVEERQGRGRLRRAAALWLQQWSLSVLGDLVPIPNVTPMKRGVRYAGWSDDPFHWRTIERIAKPGIEATVNVIVFDKDGRPRFDPGLYRAVMSEEEQPFEQPSLEPVAKPIIVKGFQKEQREHEAIVKQAERVVARDSARAKAIPGAPTSKGVELPVRKQLDDERFHVTAGAPGIAGVRVVGAMPDATPLHVAIGRKLLGIARAVDWRLNREAKRRDALLYAQVEREVRLAITEARMQLAVREASLVSPVQTSGRTDRPAATREVQQ